MEEDPRTAIAASIGLTLDQYIAEEDAIDTKLEGIMETLQEGDEDERFNAAARTFTTELITESEGVSEPAEMLRVYTTLTVAATFLSSEILGDNQYDRVVEAIRTLDARVANMRGGARRTRRNRRRLNK